MISTFILICISLSLMVCWIMFTKMSKNKAECDVSSSDDSCLSDDEQEPTLDKKMEGLPEYIRERALDIDAINPHGPRSTRLEISHVKYIEEHLDDYEKISLIFLLSDKPEHCLEKIKLSEWVAKEMLTYSFLEEKLWEAMAIIKNFQLPKMFGLHKEDLISEYFPSNQYAMRHISKFKKTLYLICENFKKTEEIAFLQELRRDLMTKNIFLPSFPQLEMYFSFLLQTRWLSKENTDNLNRILKKLSFLEAGVLLDNWKNFESSSKRNVDTELESSFAGFNSNITSDEIYNDEQIVSSSSNDPTQDNVPIKLTESSSQEIYKNNGQRICFIINQENFHTEIEEQYKHLLPPNHEEEKLSSRSGTKFDSDRLESVFEARHFDVRVEKNLNHTETITALENLVKNINIETCTCLFVIILSHGNRGVVYCANSCYITIAKIVEIMSHKKLNKIPKVLILQTCQGPSLLIADENLTTDGDTTGVEPDDPKAPNFCIFSSTVPGFASIRDKRKGTWFIQVLCDQIQALADRYHFLDICTTVTNKLSKLQWQKNGKNYYMLSYKKETFSKRLYI